MTSLEGTNEDDSYFTVGSPCGPIEFKEKGSRFISFIYPVRSTDEIQKRLKYLRKKYHNATHVCYAFRLGEGMEDSFRYIDDGEPGNTAGLPIYNEIRNAEYFNILVAVVRYFGGTKLGTGGLARAYGQSARLIVEASEKVKEWVTEEVDLSYPFDSTGDVMKIVKDFSLSIISQYYLEDGIQIKLVVPASKKKDLKRLLTDNSRGRVHFL
ncbi:IMPACT family protein [Thermodesulfobacteriota bacterium]